MCHPRPVIPLLAACVVLLGLTSPGRSAEAQLPGPSGAFTTQVNLSLDGQGMVIEWTGAPLALAGDAFVVLRRAGFTSNSPSVLIASLAPETRGYTDYEVAALGWNAYCYRVVTVIRGQYSFATAEGCAFLLPGIRGTTAPVLQPGCSRYFQTQPPGTKMEVIAARFSPSSSLRSLWRFNVFAQEFQALWFLDPLAPLDSTTLPFTAEFQYACLATTARFR